ncbi:unnamed protein product [Closterium sp. NIES-53]
MKPKARWGLHLGVSEESKGRELLDIADNRVVNTSDVVFYETLSLEVWKSKFGPASGRTRANPPTDTSTATLPLLVEVGEQAVEDVAFAPALPSPAPSSHPLPVGLRGLTSVSASGNEGSRGASPVAPAKSIAGGRRDAQPVAEKRATDMQPTLDAAKEAAEITAKEAAKNTAKETATGTAKDTAKTAKETADETADETAEEIAEETAKKPTEEIAKQLAGELSNGKRVSEKPSTGELSNRKRVSEKPSSGEQSNAELASEERTTGEQFDEGTSSDVVEVQPGPRKSGRIRRPPDFFVPAAFTTVYDVNNEDLAYDDAEDDEEFSELDPDMHADPEHRWDISTMTVKEALASWKGPAVKAAMEEEIRSLINMGTWELVERPPGVNIMKSRWVLTTKYRIDDTVEREKARLVVKGFTQVYGADYDEKYAPVSSYVTLRIFLSIVAVLDLKLMQLDMKNTFLQSKLDRVLYMYQPDHFNDGTGRVCKLLKSLYGLKKSPLLWYTALNNVLVGNGWKKSQVNEALYFKVYVDDLLVASSSTAMLKELKELLEAAFELREISLVQKYLGLEIVRDRPARKLWLHQQGYANKLRKRFINEEQNARTPKTPVSVAAYAEQTFDDEEAQEREEEEYRQKVDSLQFAAMTTRPDIAFACSKLGSGLTVRSNQHWREVDRCLAYLANKRDTALEYGGGPESLDLSEYVAAVKAGKEGRRLRFLLAEFQRLDAGKPTVLRVDNKLAITVGEGMGLTGNLKHMERRQAWLQHMVKREKFLLKCIPTAEQPADFLTKALHYPAFNRCSVAIGQVRLADVGDSDSDVQQ